MYGYLRLLRGAALPSVQGYYRSIYCSLCHAMWNNYGNRSRFLLSYDMTFLVVALNLKNQVDLNSGLLCYRKCAIQTNREEWKRISALGILLAAMKLRDNIDDDNSLVAKLGLAFFGKAAKKAALDYPEVADLLQTGFKDMSTMEKRNCDVFAMAGKFGEIMTDAVSRLFSCAEADYAVMRHVTEWVYFIDALDDLDKDMKDGSYNPFKLLASSREELIENRSDYLESFITKQMKSVGSALRHFTEGTSRNVVILSTVLETIPTVTERVLKGEKSYRTPSLITRAMEIRGGYRFV